MATNDAIEARLAIVERLLDERKLVQDATNGRLERDLTDLSARADTLANVGSANGTQLASLATAVGALSTKIDAIAKDIAPLSTAWRVGLVVASVFGATFIYLLTRVSNMSDEVNGYATVAGDKVSAVGKSVQADIAAFGAATLSTMRRSLQPPVGTVIAYGGPIKTKAELEQLYKEGWILCDGFEYDWATRSELEPLGRLLAAGSANSRFNVPDYRGVFLRGVADPDGPGGRTASDRDEPSRAVGSFQEDAVQVHGHKDIGHVHRQSVVTDKGGSNVPSFTNSSKAGMGEIDTQTGHADIQEPQGYGGIVAPRTSGESRPKNVAVNWLIKF